MTAKVVDASAFAALSYHEAEAASVFDRLDGEELHAPTLLRLEMVNVCLKKIRLHPRRRDELMEMHRQSLGVRIQQHTVDPSETLALAERFRLSAYDASYLWLAHSMDVELVTLDDKLKRPART